MILNIQKIMIFGSAEIGDFGWLRKSRNLSSYVRPSEVTHLKAPNDLSRFKNAKFLCFVVSAPTHKLNRDAIRQTWGRTLKPIFIMGKNANNRLMRAIMKEVDTHNDIILENFEDTYNNLTLKTAFVLKNFLMHFGKTEFLLKIDDDVFVNHLNIAKMLTHGNIAADVTGQAINLTKPNRDVESKWYLPHWLYGNDEFPVYINGPATIFKGNCFERNRIAFLT